VRQILLNIRLTTIELGNQLVEGVQLTLQGHCSVVEPRRYLDGDGVLSTSEGSGPSMSID
jgi:hypothetical protein